VGRLPRRRASTAHVFDRAYRHCTWQRYRARMRYADVVVVGAGVIGAATAYQLALTGRSVVVIDKLRGPGQGSTSASSAVVRFNYSIYDGIAMSWEAKHCWEHFREFLRAPTDEPLAQFHRTGLVMLDVPVAPAARAASLLGEVGVPHDVWDAETLAARVPALDARRFGPPKRLDDPSFWAESTERLGALYLPDAGYIDDPQLAAVNLARAAERAGAVFEFGQELVALDRSGDAVAGVELASGTRIDTAAVVNIGGPWSSRINDLAGVGDDFRVHVRPMRQEVHQVPAPPSYSSDAAPRPVVADLDVGTYVRPSAGGHMLVGGTEPECDPLQWVDDVDGANLNVTRDLYEAQVTRAARRFPDLRMPSAPRGVAGLYDVADDWAPIYDRTALDGYYVAIGTSGNQFKNAPFAGICVAQLVDAVQAGRDHDADPVAVRGRYTGLSINMGAFSRLRPPNPNSTGTVIG
jgi:sarcosine oxidase subunit beta